MAVYLRKEGSEDLVKFLNGKGFYIWEIDELTLEKVSSIPPFTSQAKLNTESKRSTFIECVSSNFLLAEDRDTILKKLDGNPSIMRFVFEENRTYLAYQD